MTLIIGSICLVVGALIGVFAMCLAAINKGHPWESRCTGNCEQGRHCTCEETKP